MAVPTRRDRNMRLTNIKFGMLLIILGACASIPNFVFAVDVLYSQPVFSSVSTSTVSVATGQYLGTGLTGQVGVVNMYAKQGLPLGSPRIRIYECNDATYGSGNINNCNHYIATNGGTNEIFVTPRTTPGIFSVSFAQWAYYTGSYAAGVGVLTLDPSKYYLLYLGRNTGGDITAYGLSDNTAPAGENGCVVGGQGGIFDSCGGLDALMYYVFGTGGGGGLQTEGITAINLPTYGQVVSSGDNVIFSFDYYINSLTYDKAGFTLVDNTALQSVNVSSLEDTINSSGSSNYSAVFDLITGHNYTWTPYLNNASTSQRTYGTPTLFFVGAQSNQSIPNSPTPVWNGCTNILCSGAIFSTSTGILTWNGGTTTTPFGPFGETLDSLISSKAPFSYLYDIKQVLFELGNGSTTSIYAQSCSNNDAYYALPTGVMGTQLSNGSTSIKFIDACTVKNFPVVVEIRRAITYALYLITGIGLTGMAMSII